MTTRCLLMLALLPVGGLQSAMINGIQAVVHDSVITRQEVADITAPALPALRRQFPGQENIINERLLQAERDNLEQLTQRQLILHDFKASGFNLPESVIDDLVQERIKARYGDRRRLTKSLQQEGINFEKFREKLREQFIVEAMRNKFISSEIIISPQKVETYYAAHKEEFKVEDQVKLQMIVLNRTVSPDGPEAKEVAQDLVLKIKEGTPFTELAAVYSQRAPRGSAGEWFETGGLRKELATAVTTLKAGETTGVVETPEAYYVLNVEEVKPAHHKPLEDVREAIESNLIVEERARLEKQWVEKLKKKTFVRFY